MFDFGQLEGFLYAGDFLFLASLATIIIKLKLENSSQGFSAKTQGVYGVVLCTRNIDLFFVHGKLFYLLYCLFKKIANISCIIYIVFKIKTTSKNNQTCNCNQDSFWVEALVLPCLIITAVFHYGSSPEEVLWSFSTYLEAVAMVPQFYLIHVRGKGDSYLPSYISLMAIYTLTDTVTYSLNSFLYERMPPVWPACKMVQFALNIWYILIPKEAVLPVVNCEERRRRPTLFMRQESLLAQTLFQKVNSSSDLQVFVLPSSGSSARSSLSSDQSQGSSPSPGLDTPPPSPCFKRNPAFNSESIKFKTLGLKKVRYNSGSSNTSLPSTPEPARRAELFLRSPPSAHSCKTLSHLPTNKRNALTVRMKRPSLLRLKSLPSSPVASRRSELILKSPSSVESFRSLTGQPISSTFTRPVSPNLLRPLLRLEGSTLFTPETTTRPDTQSTETPTPFSSPRPKRPPLPKFILSTPEPLPDTPLKF